ncbi:MAG: cytochrome-c oxidase, cbb3-type subunit III [Hyphomonadaceae bacterium]|nr:cytochrome-c oxidase, cbb3-type subunit III [Hyphomonadaceae bacterium]
MAEKTEIDDVSGTQTTGHEWDGVKELDTPLPRWWLYIFYASILAAIVYWVLMPAWPLVNGYTKGVLGWSDRANVASDLSALRSARAADFARLERASYAEIAADADLREFARAAGESVFGDYCRTCHGAGGAGAPGYPVLADDVWIWGGTLADIERTIAYGIRSGHPSAHLSQMPAFGRDALLAPQQIGDVTEYVISISAARTRLAPNMGAARRGATTYQEQCALCHGPTGAGDRAQGAPSLDDDLWLYGGSRAEIRRQIELGRGGVMPAWESRFDPATRRALAVYVYEMGGGEPDPPPAPAEAPAATPMAAPQ